jgi:hypothetical protein
MSSVKHHDPIGVQWWNSRTAMRKAARRSAILAGCCAVLAAVSWPITWMIAVPAAVLGMTAVLASAFAWFRLDDLRGRDAT